MNDIQIYEGVKWQLQRAQRMKVKVEFDWKWSEPICVSYKSTSVRLPSSVACLKAFLDGVEFCELA